MSKTKKAETDVVVMGELSTKHMANSIDLAATLEEKKMYAEQMIRSGLLPHNLATIEQLEDSEYKEIAIGAVIAVVEYGRELKITPWVALNGLHIVTGRVVMGVHMYTGLALKNNILVSIVDDYKRVYNASKVLIDYITTIEITRKHDHFGGLVKEYKYSKRWSEIKKAGLAEKENYRKMPVLMLRTRCITEALRLYASDIFMGTYESSEMLDADNKTYDVDDEGNVIYDQEATNSKNN